MRNTIKNHIDFAMTESDPTAISRFFIVRAKAAKFPDDPRYGLTATKKTFKLAVNRNRAKRLLRDWIAYHQDLMCPDRDYVFIARHAILDATRDGGRTAMSRALKHIARECKRMGIKKNVDS